MRLVNADPKSALQSYYRLSEEIPGWTRGVEAEALAERVLAAPAGAVVIEIGSFYGSGSVLLAGARKVAGSGHVHCVDPFDLSGDDFSVPYYRAIASAFSGRSQRQWFDENIRKAGLTDFVTVHQIRAEDVGAEWGAPVDFIFMDGDQSPEGTRAAYLAWEPWLKPGGVMALHNSEEREYAPSHDGHYRLVQEFILTPAYTDVECVGSITFARKVV
jgi:hypothetical protein